MTTATAENEKKEEVKGGELLFCGVTEWDDVGRRKGSSELNLVSPTRLRPLVGVDIRYVAAGCAAVHCVALDVDGRCFTWGRNDGQLGHGDRVRRDMPTIVSALASYKVVKAGSGKSHTVIATEDGLSFSFGWNKHGQLGTGSAKKEFELDPVRCLVTEVTKVACGADFTVWLTSVEGASILTAGLPQYGQLGHGSDMEYNTKDSSVKLAYEAQPRPTAIASFADETIVNVACGSNHTVAVDSKGYVYTWGFGGYGRLGHREQKDEFTPRRVDVFTKHNVLPPGAILSAGSANSAVTAGAGQMYMWGKIKNTGDDLMYPKPLMDLSGWNVRCMDSGYMHHFVGAESSCISWGQCHSGELGYGPHQQKSSAIPKKVDALEDMHVISVACGFAHSLVVVDRTNAGDQLDQLEIYDGEGVEEPRAEPSPAKQSKKRAAAAAKTSNKRKQSKEASDLEDEEENNNEEDGDDSDPEANAVAEKKSKRGGKAAGRGRGRGRPPAAKNIQQEEKRAAAAAKTSNKRKKSKEASDPEDEEENNEEDDDDSDPEANAVAETKSKRGGKASGRGRGRGRPAAAKKEDSGAASAKRGRGRPKKA
ncbi:putative chromatin remodeling & transcriptional activation HMG family [Helianthus annuus]|uniref:Chromatin remodeling & transcriptional activation HMG family n=1 Tax=Helianthus annuus TaxID=4232 RepID=A0A9K3J5N1_HELAN|nr:putative chromatin remodeling & transcriptional activation HMG family [Helianthus annuus]KAJ0580286.1 putative chromatin remodeling & transcriptional activation HMG family [Helianthus annuus]KAJ0596231.1 putative chromatin remodeling & transcriptional activation HMG family [Helianthus annuus]KAJ0930421.1 putative chromatin remodeling & transcriptional activation HMG family [Helianthus annuus]